MALALVDTVGDRIRSGELTTGDKLPPEAAIMGEFGVSRTVVREALSMLQAQKLVATRHGIGTFVLAPRADDDALSFRVTAEQVATLRDVVAVLEVRIALESEAASLAAVRRRPDDLQRLRAALDALSAAMARGEDAAELDFRFHLEIARASHNLHFANLMGALGTRSIPRARLGEPAPDDGPGGIYLRGVQAEHESIYDAIAAGDQEAARGQMRMHLVNSRERRRRAADQADGGGVGAGGGLVAGGAVPRSPRIG
ncbi:MAG: FadR/GntR family transcriptional regulator [Rubrivivax sp.]